MAESDDVGSIRRNAELHPTHTEADEVTTRRSDKHKSRRLFLARGPNYVRDKLHGRLFLIPSCITVVGMFCGFLAIMSAIKGNFDYAARCIMLAIVLDGLDGRVARSLNATSAFGREFDSLSDLVAFGVAPAVIMYSWAFSSIADEFGVLVGFVFVVCSATRLARFNVMTSEDSKSGFVGMPTPGAAAGIVCLSYASPQPLDQVFVVGLVSAYMFLISFLMVSTLPFASVKKIKLKRENQLMILLVLAILVSFAWKYSRIVFFTGSTAYAMSGIAIWISKFYRRDRETLPPETRSA